MAGPLSGIRIIDFGQYIAGPLAAMMLGDQGAEVIRVDPPGGPRLKSPADAVWNRGKRRITLNLKDEGDRETARRLVGTADVVIENFRPGVMERLGLGPEAMLAANPALIYTSLPGFASDDPRAGVPGWEGVVGAATATYNGRGAAEVQFTPVPMASNFAAFTAVNSVVAALIARERTGRGQRIETPMFDAMFEAFGSWGQKNMAAGSDQPTLPGRVVDPLGGGFYQCADDRWVQLLVMRPRHFDWVAAGIFPAEWKDEGLADRDRLRAEPALAAELRKRLGELFRTKTSWEWEKIVNQIGTPFCVCRTTDEWLRDPHAIATRSVVPVNDPELGPTMQAGFPVALSRSTPENPAARRPLDADRAAIIDELASRPAPMTGPGDGSLAAALEGIRVIDTTQIWAGPTAGRVLAEYGADVIKINDTSGDVLSHLHVNSGKRSLLLNLQSPAGLEVLWKLLERTDVFMQNFRKGTAERLGMGEAAVRARKPDVVYSSVSAYGYDGPRGADRGWEPVGQAATGMQLRTGVDEPMGQAWALCDYGTGLMGAYSVLLGLFHRARTGEGQAVQAALSMTGTLHQTPFMIDYEGRSWEGIPGGAGVKGAAPLQRLYKARDGWFYLGGRDDQRSALAAVEGLEGVTGLSGDALEAELEARFATGDTQQWVDRLLAAGFGAHRLTALEEVMEDAWAKAHHLSVVREHEGVGPVRMVGPSPRLSATPVVVPFPARQPGADAPGVLAEAGVGAMDSLVREGVVAVP